MLRRRALLYESIHPGTAFVVGKGAGDHARGEVIGPGHSEVHLLIEGALARGEGFGRLFRKLFGKAHDFRVESIRGNDTVHQAPFQRLLRINSVAGQEQLHRALAQQVAAHSDTRGRAEKAPADSRGGELRRIGRDRRSHCATSWQPAAAAAPCTRAMTGCGSAVIVCIIRLHCANSFSIFGRSFSARISFRSWPAQKPFPAPASTTTRIFLSETKESKA